MVMIHNIYLVFVFSRHSSKRESLPVTISVIKVKNEYVKKAFLMLFYVIFSYLAGVMTNFPATTALDLQLESILINNYWLFYFFK